MSLAKAAISRVVRVLGVRSGDAACCRLMEMGFVEGAKVEVIGRAPLGDPLRVRIDDYDLSLRAEDAALISVSS